MEQRQYATARTRRDAAMNAVAKSAEFALQEGEGTAWESFTCRSADGLRLHNRFYGASETARTAVVCLPGLARTSADFHELALHLSAHPKRPRRVLAMDYRGRGRSDYDPNPANYDVRIEMQDVLDVMTAAGLHEAIFIGTSRGGLITMGLSAMRPGVIRAAVLNDIGPVIEAKGIARIKGYVGKLPPVRDHSEATQLMKRVAGAHFPRLTEAEWQGFAARTFKQGPNGLISDYDPQLLVSLAAFDLEKPLPVLWPYFEGLKNVPVLSIRGSHSDLLSEDTQIEMARRHPGCETLTVQGEGHAPLLGDRPTLTRIAAFVHRAEDEKRTTAL
jgi:pimeloyl-ACP methyl ester carboxylesterase